MILLLDATRKEQSIHNIDARVDLCDVGFS